eukprot:11206080-Lingulodinium_polyedra.AAC.1
MERWMEGIGLRTIPVQGCTHRGPHGNRRLDILATLVDSASRWCVQRRWHPGLSDHAALWDAPTPVAARASSH